MQRGEGDRFSMWIKFAHYIYLACSWSLPTIASPHSHTHPLTALGAANDLHILGYTKITQGPCTETLTLSLDSNLSNSMWDLEIYLFTKPSP